MRKSSNKHLGQYGEQIAQKYLTACGYEILALNYRSRFGEIDLIGKKIAATGCDSQIVFFEVKTRKGSGFGLPEESVGREKIRKILKTAYKFLEENGLYSVPQIDVISIKLNMYNVIEELKHLPRIYEF